MPRSHSAGSSWCLRAAGLTALMTALMMGTLPPAAEAGTRVYLMRGLLDVSTGLDDLAAKLKRRGISAVVTSYTAEAELSATAIRNYKSGTGCPVVIIGHSLGADAALSMAETLQRATVPVALVVAFSPAKSRSVPGNVARVVNYYQSNSAWNNVYSRGPGFKGSLRNVNLAREANIDHFNIEKMSRLHDETIRAVAGLGGCGPAAGQDTVGRKASGVGVR